METLKNKKISWHNFYRPTSRDVAWLQSEFSFHKIVLEELLHPTLRPEAQRFDGYLYLVLHFPVFNEKERRTYPREIDFLMTKKELITASYEPIPVFDSFFKKCVTEKSCEELYASGTPTHLLYYLVKELYGFSLRELDHIQERINRIEEDIFSGKERAVVAEISVVGRDIIDFRRAVKPQGITLESLAREGELLFGQQSAFFLTELIGEYQKLWGLLETHKETLDALYETNTTLLNIKQSDTIRTLTIIATTTFPLSLLTTLFTINARANPIVGAPFDFWIIVGLILAVAGAILGVFKKKKWW